MRFSHSPQLFQLTQSWLNRVVALKDDVKKKQKQSPADIVDKIIRDAEQVAISRQDWLAYVYKTVYERYFDKNIKSFIPHWRSDKLPTLQNTMSRYRARVDEIEKVFADATEAAEELSKSSTKGLKQTQLKVAQQKYEAALWRSDAEEARFVHVLREVKENLAALELMEIITDVCMNQPSRNASKYNHVTALESGQLWKDLACIQEVICMKPTPTVMPAREWYIPGMSIARLEAKLTSSQATTAPTSSASSRSQSSASKTPAKKATTTPAKTPTSSKSTEGSNGSSKGIPSVPSLSSGSEAKTAVTPASANKSTTPNIAALVTTTKPVKPKDNDTTKQAPAPPTKESSPKATTPKANGVSSNGKQSKISTPSNGSSNSSTKAQKPLSPTPTSLNLKGKPSDLDSNSATTSSTVVPSTKPSAQAPQKVAIYDDSVIDAMTCAPDPSPMPAPSLVLETSSTAPMNQPIDSVDSSKLVESDANKQPSEIVTVDDTDTSKPMEDNVHPTNPIESADNDSHRKDSNEIVDVSTLYLTLLSMDPPTPLPSVESSNSEKTSTVPPKKVLLPLPLPLPLSRRSSVPPTLSMLIPVLESFPSAESNGFTESRPNTSLLSSTMKRKQVVFDIGNDHAGEMSKDVVTNNRNSDTSCSDVDKKENMDCSNDNDLHRNKRMKIDDQDKVEDMVVESVSSEVPSSSSQSMTALSSITNDIENFIVQTQQRLKELYSSSLSSNVSDESNAIKELQQVQEVWITTLQQFQLKYKLNQSVNESSNKRKCDDDVVIVDSSQEVEVTPGLEAVPAKALAPVSGDSTTRGEKIVTSVANSQEEPLSLQNKPSMMRKKSRASI